ncbi:MEKHLA domain-containing protein [Paenibacillus sp. MWE-103]|uniref:MEKHLA domain-containing protein n=1 Tax=Paenibacillus artemisiicola TaxID=1172618 RepID=A0ABS3WHE3_9BACL|nr:MEKHLA domain-containing protein [Paenibacillus artemisiicola]MBO7747710.1 MEKHLA domain-containing protein [Paenibacillus artemisiicola]
MMRSTDIGASERHARIVLDSYRKLLGKPLLETEGSGSAAEQLFEAPIAVLSHGTEADPVLNYGNRTALGLWEMDWASFTSMPSRLTAEPLVREERQRFMEAVAAKGYIDDYSGVRISGTGRRFRIEQAVVWNLYDESGAYYGQAAAFAGYTRL